MTVSEAAARLGIEYDYCLRLCRTGRLRARKIRRQWVVDHESVRERLLRVARRRATGVEVTD